MKIVVVNGSPRKGNTWTAIQAFAEGAKAHEIEIINADKLDISGCKGCGACQCFKGCVAKDETNPTIDKLVAADMILFASPVYWWGVSAQLKTVIDKMYCRGAQIKGKKIGLIAIGGDSTESIQYDLIEKQFGCMADYLKWDVLFTKRFSATATDDLAKDEAAIAELKEIGEEI